MTDSNDPNTPPPPPPDEPSQSPFPESSLGSSDPPPDPGLWASPSPPSHDSAPEAPTEVLPGEQPPSDATPPAYEAPPEAPAYTPPPSYDISPSAPLPGGLAGGDPLGGGLAGGDPLGGSAFPGGYSSPPPPGAGGLPSEMPGGSSPAAPAAGTYVLSGWWRRVGAAAIDGLIIGIVALVIMTPLGFSAFAVSDDSSTGALGLIAVFFLAFLLFAVIAMAYAPVMMSKTNGKTLGRMATGIRVVRTDGQKITLGFAALREIAVKALLIGGVASSLTFGVAGLLDVLWPLWDDENRALHDMIVNTRTVIG